MSLSHTSRLPWSFRRFSVRGIKNAQFSIYLHFICCTVMQRIKEAVAVKPTLKSLRGEISFLKAGFDAPLHSRVACIGSKGDFFPPYVWVHLHTCVWECGGERKKLYEEAGDSESSGQFCASCVTLLVELHTCVINVIYNTIYFFPRFLCAILEKHDAGANNLVRTIMYKLIDSEFII